MTERPGGRPAGRMWKEGKEASAGGWGRPPGRVQDIPTLVPAAPPTPSQTTSQQGPWDHSRLWASLGLIYLSPQSEQPGPQAAESEVPRGGGRAGS